MSRTHTYTKYDRGFTIVELIVVIVVIAILAAITMVAYTGIQGRANDTAVQSDLRNIGQILEIFYIENGYYPTPSNTDMSELGIRISESSHYTKTNNFFYCHNNDGHEKIGLVTRSASNDIYYYAANGTVDTGDVTSLSSSTTFCPQIGAPITATNNTNRTIIYSSSTGWVDWVK